jgi:hypothetical protein
MRYRFVVYLDGVHEDERGPWVVEFKLRRSLTSFEQVALSRQTRGAAWSWWRTTGTPPVGAITAERWNEIPREARVLKDGSVSRAKDQLTTPRAYVKACLERDASGCCSIAASWRRPGARLSRPPS